MMELTDRIREMLRKEYGIGTDEELMQAIRNQKRADIGIFVSGIGMEERNAKAVI